MLLRTRLTLISIAAFLVIALSVGVTAFFVGRTLIAEVNEQEYSQEAALLQQTMLASSTELDSTSTLLAEDPAFIDAVRTSSLDKVRQSIQAVVAKAHFSGRPDQIEIETPGGQFLFRYPSDGRPSRLLDQASRDKLLTAASLSGFRASDAEHGYIVSATPLRSGDQLVGIIAVGVDATRVIDKFAAANQSKASLVTLRGQLIYTNDLPLWDAIKNSISLREAGRVLSIDWPKVVGAATIPVVDALGSRAGVVVSYRDISDSASVVISNIAIVGLAFAFSVAVVAILVQLHLRASFRPLEQTVEVTRALAQGDLSQEVEAVGNDEIGRIGEAVRQLRLNALAAAELARQRRRSRQRRERLIRREVGALANALDESSRAEILAILASDVPRRANPDGAPTHSDTSDHQLRLIAGVLRDLARRILDQRTKLTEIIGELEAALADKNVLVALQQQLQIARDVQRSILPRDYALDPRVLLHGQMTPASEIGGDFYDCFMIDADRLAVAVADVSGKGIPASLFMGVTRTLLRAVARFSDDPATLLTEVNDILQRDNEQMLFVTACLGFLDLRTGLFQYVNAGHSSPILIDADRREVMELPQAKGIALAVTDLAHFEVLETQLTPGQTLFLYTDGISEAMNGDGKLYGNDRLLASLKDFASLEVSVLCERIERNVRIFEAGIAPTDDLTCLALQYIGERAPRVCGEDAIMPGAGRFSPAST